MVWRVLLCVSDPIRTVCVLSCLTGLYCRSRTRPLCLIVVSSLAFLSLSSLIKKPQRAEALIVAATSFLLFMETLPPSCRMSRTPSRLYRFRDSSGPVYLCRDGFCVCMNPIGADVFLSFWSAQFVQNTSKSAFCLWSQHSTDIFMYEQRIYALVWFAVTFKIWNTVTAREKINNLIIWIVLTRFIILSVRVEHAVSCSPVGAFIKSTVICWCPISEVHCYSSLLSQSREHEWAVLNI